jgi:phage terminase large subunit-like protein
MIKSYKESKSYKYSLAVVSGEIVASKFIIKQAKSYLADLENDDYYFDLDWHNKVSIWFEKICYVPELSSPVPLPLPHAFWVEQVHCLRLTESGRRKYRQAYIQVARKQAKTFYAAINSLFELIWGSDNRPQITCGANSREQAILCTKMMGDIVKCSPALMEMVEDKQITFFTWQKDVTGMHYDNGKGRVGKIEAMSRNPGDGSNPSVTIVDELHEATNLSLLETMKSGQGLRENPMAIIITSPGHNKDAPCYSVLRDRAVKQLDGIISDESFLPILFELDEEEDWDNEDELIKSNPMIPYMDTLLPFLKERIKEAKNVGGGTEVNIKIKNCGIWVDAAETWISSDIVKANNHGITEKELLGKECYAGLDLAKGEDLNAYSLLFPNVRPNVHVLKTMFWIPEDKIQNNRDHVDYQKWIDDGLMIKQDGDTANHVDIANDIIKDLEKYDLISFGYDSKYAIMALIPMLAEAGFESRLLPIGQGFTLSPAVIQMSDWLHKHELDLMHNKVFYWNMANVVMRVGDQGDQFPSKGRSGNKIDGVSAGLTSVAAYLIKNAQPLPSPVFVIGLEM